jgi:hypothetical protein
METLGSEQRLTRLQTSLPKINTGSLSVTQLARYQVSRFNEFTEQEDQLLFKIAAAGIHEINKRAGTNARLLASTSEEGQLNGIEFRSKFFSFRTPLQSGDN